MSLIDPGLAPDVLRDPVSRFQPAIAAVLDEEPRLATTPPPRASRYETYPDLAVLLAPSGSTDDPKLVRLSRTAVTANAAAKPGSVGVTIPGHAMLTEDAG